MGDYQEAILDCCNAIQWKPNYALAYNERGRLKLSLGDMDGAISDIEQAIIIAPNNGNYYKSLGDVKKTLEAAINSTSSEVTKLIKTITFKFHFYNN